MYVFDVAAFVVLRTKTAAVMSFCPNNTVPGRCSYGGYEHAFSYFNRYVRVWKYGLLIVRAYPTS